MKNILTIAGSDPTGGAGIQADLKVFHSLGLHGLSVITAITVQNTTGVKDIMPLPPEAVRDQLSALLEDMEVSAIKTGMLYSRRISTSIAETLKGLPPIPLVLDPVTVSSSGKVLTEDEGIEGVITPLLPFVTVMTPNIYEAQLLTGITITGTDDAKRAARELTRRGPSAVIVTGGHLGQEKDIQDICYMEGRFYEMEGRRYPGEYHGTGCFFSSALASYIALGQPIMEAAMHAKKLTTDAIGKAFRPGRGMGILRT